MLGHVADEQQRRNHASTAYCQQGDSVEEYTCKIERISYQMKPTELNPNASNDRGIKFILSGRKTDY
jgi:hypothetical protein